jgi:hypothetical protein
MMLFAVAALVHGSMLFRRALLEYAINMIEPADKGVQASVDGEPVYSYVLEGNDKGRPHRSQVDYDE